MKLARFGPVGRERPAVVLDGGERVDCSGFGLDWNEAFFASDGLPRLAAWLDQHRDRCPRIAASERTGAPIVRPSKIVGIGLNYSDHAAEMNVAIPEEPVLFQKSSSSLCGAYDDLVVPRGATKLDWEVELAFVIGRTARNVTPERALHHVFGYALACDYSERAWQKERRGQFTKGKSFDGAFPLGPFLATADEIADPQSIGLRLAVNGDVRQDGSTRDMIFGVAPLVAYVSQFMTLLPGDVITTGTPAGVGLGMKPERFLGAGDLVELAAEGLGSQRQRIRGRATVPMDDWRRQGQAHFLDGARLRFGTYRQPRPSWDHDHCEFCHETLSEHEGTLREGYSTLDEYRWICAACFADFREEFGFVVEPSS